MSRNRIDTLSKPVREYAQIQFDAATQVFVVTDALEELPFENGMLVAPLHVLSIYVEKSAEQQQVRIFAERPMARTFRILLLDWAEHPRGRAILGYLSYSVVGGVMEASDYRMSLARGQMPEIFRADTVLMLGIRFVEFRQPIHLHSILLRNIGTPAEARDRITLVKVDIHTTRMRADQNLLLRPRIRLSDRVIDRPTRVITRNIRVPVITPLAVALEDVVIEETVEISHEEAANIDLGEPIQQSTVRESPLVARRRAVMAGCCKRLKEEAEKAAEQRRQRLANAEPIASGSGEPLKSTGAIPKTPKSNEVEEDPDDFPFMPIPIGYIPLPDNRVRLYEQGFYVPGQEILSSGRYYWCDPYGEIGVRQSYGSLGPPYGTTRAERIPTYDVVTVPPKEKTAAELELERTLDHIDVSVRTTDTRDYDVDEKFYHDCKQVAREMKKNAGILESNEGIEGNIATPSESEDIAIVGGNEITESEIDRAVNTCPICDMLVENAADRKVHMATCHSHDG